MKILCVIVLFVGTQFLAKATETVVWVTPGRPQETFLIGAETKANGDYITFLISIAPRTTKPTWPFDCALTVKDRRFGWHIDLPCYDEKKKKPDGETISLQILKTDVPDAIFEFRFALPSGETEIWRIKLKDYENGVNPE